MSLEFRENETTNMSPWTVVGSSKTRLVQCTPELDKSCAFIARVSSKNQGNPSVAGLLRYCAKHGHWSVFEQGSSNYRGGNTSGNRYTITPSPLVHLPAILWSVSGSESDDTDD